MWNYTFTNEFNQRYGNMDLNKLLKDQTVYLANGILEEKFENWHIPSLIIDGTNPFSRRNSTFFATLLLKHQENSVFRSLSIKGKIFEAISDLKNLFKNLNLEKWNQVEQISLNYPPAEALRLIWTDKDLGVNEAINATLFLDEFYSSTKLLISVVKDFNKANVSTKIYHNERNISSLFKFLYLLVMSMEKKEEFSGKILISNILLFFSEFKYFRHFSQIKLLLIYSKLFDNYFHLLKTQIIL